MQSADSKIYPGIARTPNTFGTPDPADPAKLIVTTSHPAPYTRKVAVYVPRQYVAGTAAPFIVGADGPDKLLFTALDHLIAAKKLPPMIAISIANGSGDAQGSERGLEYDTMSGRYAEFVETEVLPLVEKNCGVKLSHDPDARATTGGSSGGSCALIMAWYHPELYHRVLTWSGTYVNQQWPPNPAAPHGAWREALAADERRPDRIVVSNVAGPAFAADLTQWTRERYALNVEFIVAEACRLGLTNGYRQPQRLGVDRWLSMLAVWPIQRSPTLVVSAGTALTADAIADGGRSAFVKQINDRGAIYRDAKPRQIVGDDARIELESFGGPIRINFIGRAKQPRRRIL
jgi:hypothetical protein